jgi:hypothetical protein
MMHHSLSFVQMTDKGHYPKIALFIEAINMHGSTPMRVRNIARITTVY